MRELSVVGSSKRPWTAKRTLHVQIKLRRRYMNVLICVHHSDSLLETSAPSQDDILINIMTNSVAKDTTQVIFNTATPRLRTLLSARVALLQRLTAVCK